MEITIGKIIVYTWCTFMLGTICLVPVISTYHWLKGLIKQNDIDGTGFSNLGSSISSIMLAVLVIGFNVVWVYTIIFGVAIHLWIPIFPSLVKFMLDIQM